MTPKVGKSPIPSEYTSLLFEKKGDYTFFSMRAFEVTSGLSSTLCAKMLKAAIQGCGDNETIAKLAIVSKSKLAKICFVKHIDKLKRMSAEDLYIYLKAAALRDLYAFNMYKADTVNVKVWYPYIDMEKVANSAYLLEHNGQLYFKYEHEHLF